MNSEVISVSQYLDGLNWKLKTEKAKISGEVCDLKMYPERSYLYFSIKDSKDQSMLKCFMWKRDFKISGVDLRDGVEVAITAYPNVYKPNGGLTMQVESVELLGEGALELAYRELKKKLEAEGLFSEERKRLIPKYSQRIGLITSKSGAVINDFLSNIGKFGFEILFVDSKVEGQDAIKDLLSAVKTLRKEEIDVLIIMRGGGSLESFLAFNNEVLIREVASFPVSVLTGIGHDKDAPLLSLVSDKNVSTPTAVANLLNAGWNEALSTVRLSEEKILSQFSSGLKDRLFSVENSKVTIESHFGEYLDIFRRAEETLVYAIGRIESGIKIVGDSISLQSRELFRSFSRMSDTVKDFLIQSGKTLELGSPERQLGRGYSIVRAGGKILRSMKNIKKGDKLDILVSDGTIASKVI